MSKNTVIGIVSIILGGIIYVLWREQTLLMFKWFDSLGLTPAIILIRSLAVAYLSILPNWLCYSLPNALWFFGGVLLFSSIWKNFFAERILWISIFVVIGIGCEIGQLAGVLPGTYDNTDIVLMLMFIPLAILIGNNQVIKEVKDGKDA